VTIGDFAAVLKYRGYTEREIYQIERALLKLVDGIMALQYLCYKPLT
jgi:hypothetical protein